MKEMFVGQHVKFCTEVRLYVDALITAVHGEPTEYPESDRGPAGVQYPCVNLVFVVPSEDQQDQYGRQIDRSSSVMHYSSGGAAPGYCWLFADEGEEASKAINEALASTKA